MWKLDDILLSSYGVGVRKTSGVLDMPKLVDKANDWLDLDSVDYWQDAADAKYGNRELVLHCWMASHTDYADFKTKVAAFFAAITAAGTRTLKYDTSTIAEVYLEKQVELPRKTAYVSSLQVGFFSLRLTVPGDPDYMALTIKRWTGTETLNVASVLTKNLKITKSLQGDWYATCTFESNTKLDLKYFDYIGVTSNGSNEDRFYLGADPNFEKKSTNLYKYDLRFEHQGKWLESSQFLNDLDEGEFDYYANIDEIVDLIVTNHNRSWWSNFQKGTVFSTERRNHRFKGESCLGVLRRVCVEYELEYEFEFVSAGVYKINIKEQVANDKITTLEYGKGNGLYELTREAPNIDELCTKLFAFGSTKNIPAGYRSGMLRLSFDNNPITQNDDLYTESGPHEKTIFFDDIYPRRTGTVTAYTQILTADLTDAQKEIYPDGLYKIADSTLFNINDYLSNGLKPKIRFITGDNAGLEFEIYRYNHDTFEMFIVPNKDIRGTLFPNATLKPAIGDDYVLVDIEMPTSYKTAAEAELEAATQDYSDEFSVVKFPYRVKTDPAFLADNPDGYEVGDRIPLLDTDIEVDGLYRISELEFDVYRQIYDFRLSDLARLTYRQKMENRLAAVERAMEATRSHTVERMRNSHRTGGELERILLDPDREVLRADGIVSNRSIDPRMLSMDAGTLQWSVKDALVEANYGGDEDDVRIEAGSITYHNWAGLDRYAIQKIKDDGGSYDPTRTWTINQTDFTLANSNCHWMYAKINLTSGSSACDIIVSENHIEGKYEIADNYLYLKMGFISSSASPRYAAMIFGNVKITAGGEANVQSDWNQSDTGADDFIKNKPDLLQLGETSTTAYRGDRGKTAYDHSQSSHAPANAEQNVQSNWNEADSGNDAYIQNKPAIPDSLSQLAGDLDDILDGVSYKKSENNLTNTLKTQYDAAYTHSQAAHAPSNAEQNVQSDWNQTNTVADSYIKNKPAIPDSLDDLSGDMDDISNGANYVKTQNNLSDTLKNQYDSAYTHSQEAHAPYNAEQNVQSDWNQTNTVVDSYIKNKPAIPDSLDDLSGDMDDISNGANYVKTQNNLSDTLKNQYDSAYTHSQEAHAPYNAEQNVQSDWNQSSTGADDYIKNKPTIPTVYWGSTNGYVYTTGNEGIISKNGGFFGYNVYYSSGWKHIASGHAMFMKQESTSFNIYVSDTSRSAGSTVTTKVVQIQNSTGNLIAENFVLNSMRKLKARIKKIFDLSRFDKIPIYQFYFKNDDSKRTRYGVIAEDVEKVAPELVFTDEKGMKTVAYIDYLVAKIARLEERLKKVEE
jgi:endosialidase-like protein